jgi:hypothetical protein
MGNPEPHRKPFASSACLYPLQVYGNFKKRPQVLSYFFNLPVLNFEMLDNDTLRYRLDS